MKQKQDREKPIPQAAVRVVDPEPEKGATEDRVLQAPVITLAMAPQPAQQAAPAVPQVFPIAPAAGQLQAQQMPPIHVHLSPGGTIQQPMAGRGRGGPPMRGRWRRPQGPQQPRGPPPGQVIQQYQSRFQCWGCGQAGHMQRDCPVNPWAGPQNHCQVPHNPQMIPDQKEQRPMDGPSSVLAIGVPREA